MDVLTQAVAGALSDLRWQMQGHVVASDDPDYAAVGRIWNGAVDHRPALFAICETVGDVQAAVHAARKHSLQLSVLGGGHDWAGRSIGHQALVIDLSKMKGVDIDVRTQTATVRGSATAADVVAAAAPHGLTAVVGSSGKTGMAGFTLAGGYGPLMPGFGLGVDNLISAEVVLADGRHVTASATENVDLLWALRGGGGNFGVVTSMQIRLHPVREVLAGKILFPWSDARQVFNGFAKVMESAPDELGVTAAVLSGPNGDPLVVIAPCWSGNMEQGRAIVDGLQRLGTPLLAEIGPMACSDFVNMFDAAVPNGRRYMQQTRWLRELGPESITAVLKAGSNKASPFSVVIVQSFHGVAARVPLEATSFGLRQKHLIVSIIAAWDAGADDDLNTQWAQDTSRALERFALPGGYSNVLGPDEHSQIALAYGSNTDRLLDLKRRFDPASVFNATPLPA